MSTYTKSAQICGPERAKKLEENKRGPGQCPILGIVESRGLIQASEFCTTGNKGHGAGVSTDSQNASEFLAA